MTGLPGRKAVVVPARAWCCWANPAMDAVQFADLVTNLLEIAAAAIDHSMGLRNKYFTVSTGTVATLIRHLGEQALNSVCGAVEIVECINKQPLPEIPFSVPSGTRFTAVDFGLTDVGALLGCRRWAPTGLG
jgi:hypothetical protein